MAKKYHIPWNKGKKILSPTENQLKYWESKRGKKPNYVFPKGHRPWNKGTKGLMVPVWNKGIPITEEAREKNRLAHLGKKLTEEHKTKISLGNKGNVFSEETRKKMSLAMTGIPHLKARGKLHHNWKGGITPEYKHTNCTVEYKKWRSEVFERDNYTCQKCGATNIYLQAHHIKSWIHYKELRYNINNGLTLCEVCHKLTDNYCGRAVGELTFNSKKYPQRPMPS